MLNSIKRPLLFCLTAAFLSIGLSPMAFASLAKFPDATSGKLFQVSGSNTVGASLMKSLLVNYLEAKGASKVRAVPLSTENEYRVEGLVKGLPVFVEVAAHGSSTGFKALLGSSTDIAMSSRPIKGKEVDGLAGFGNMRSFDAEHVIAIDGLAVVVHRNNPVQQLNLDQLAAIFSGQISNWREVGGDNRVISLYARDDKSGTWDTFKSLVLRKKVKLSSDARRFESNDELSDLVSGDVGGIGFVGLASVRSSRALLVSDVGTQALVPEKVSVATEDYPLSRRLFLYTPPQQSMPFIREFIGFIQTDEGQQQVQETGFVSQVLITTPVPEVRRGPREYLELTQGAQRLSVNFRFDQGSARLDNKAQQDIQRLVAYMSREENQGKRLTLIGFGDAKQTQARAMVLSKLRAVAVKSALRKVGISTAPVAGFGAYLPVAANSGSGKVKNRRVEVWVN